MKKLLNHGQYDIPLVSPKCKQSASIFIYCCAMAIIILILSLFLK